MSAPKRGFLAVAKAPTKERRHRRISADGATEAEALAALGSKLAELGVTDATVDVVPLDGGGL